MSKSTRIYLIRHGEVVGHHELRYNGHSDVDITESGVAQMNRIADYISSKPISAVYSSDLKRAYKGAEIIGQRLGIKTERLKALRELHLGRWEGLTRDEAMQRYPDDEGFSFRDLANGNLIGGESLLELRQRVMPVIEGIINKHRGGCIAIVAHGGVNRVILCDAFGLTLGNFFRMEQDYGCLNLIDYLTDGTQVVKMLNGGPNQELNPVNIY